MLAVGAPLRFAGVVRRGLIVDEQLPARGARHGFGPDVGEMIAIGTEGIFAQVGGSAERTRFSIENETPSSRRVGGVLYRGEIEVLTVGGEAQRATVGRDASGGGDRASYQLFSIHHYDPFVAHLATISVAIAVRAEDHTKRAILRQDGIEFRAGDAVVDDHHTAAAIGEGRDMDA